MEKAFGGARVTIREEIVPAGSAVPPADAGASQLAGARAGEIEIERARDDVRRVERQLARSIDSTDLWTVSSFARTNLS